MGLRMHEATRALLANLLFDVDVRDDHSDLFDIDAVGDAMRWRPRWDARWVRGWGSDKLPFL